MGELWGYKYMPMAKYALPRPHQPIPFYPVTIVTFTSGHLLMMCLE